MVLCQTFTVLCMLIDVDDANEVSRFRMEIENDFSREI